MAPVGTFVLAECAVNARNLLDARDLQDRLATAASSIPAVSQRCMRCWYYKADSDKPHDFATCLGQLSVTFFPEWVAFRNPVKFPSGAGFCYMCGFHDRTIGCGRTDRRGCQHKDILKPLGFVLAKAGPEHQQKLLEAVGGTWSGSEDFLRMLWTPHPNRELYAACIFLHLYESREAQAALDRENNAASGSGSGVLRGAN